MESEYKYKPLQEMHVHEYDVQIPDGSQYHNARRFLQTDSDKRKGRPRYSRGAWCLHPRVVLTTGPCYTACRSPGNTNSTHHMSIQTGGFIQNLSVFILYISFIITIKSIHMSRKRNFFYWHQEVISNKGEKAKKQEYFTITPKNMQFDISVLPQQNLVPELPQC
jgi:hypothetical protein